MATNVEETILRITGESSGGEAAVDRLANKLGSLGVKTKSGSDSLAGLGAASQTAEGGLSGLSNAIAAVGAAFGIAKIAGEIKAIAGEALNAYATYERLTLSLQSLAAKEMVQAGAAKNVKEAFDQAAPVAQELVKWIQQLAIESPFTQDDVAQSFRLAMAYGFTTTEAQRLTTAMIDFASGTGASGAAMQRIALALGQIKARGKLSGQELMQLTEAGLNVRDALVKAGTVAGLTAANFQDMQEKGLIPADKAIQGIVKSLETDFAGAAKKQAGTFSGLLSSLSDIKTVGLRELFSGTFKAIQPAIQAFVNTLSSSGFMNALRSIGDLVGKMAPLLGVGAAMGTVTSAVVGAAIAFKALAVPIIALKAILPTVAAPVLALNAALLVIVGAVALFGLAWQNNWGGIRTAIESAWTRIQPLLSQLGSLISSWGAVFSQQAQQIWNTFVTVLQPVLAWFAENIGQIDWGQIFAGLSDTINVIGGFISSILTTIQGLLAGQGEAAFAPLNDAFINILTLLAMAWDNLVSEALTWGYNLVISLANGVLSGAGALGQAVVDVINAAITPLLQAFSPPKAGPLAQIAVWGKGLMDTYVRAFKTADFGLLDEALSPIETALKAAVSSGALDTSGFTSLFGTVRTQVAQLISIFRQTGTISQEELGKIGAALGPGSEELTKFLRLSLEYQKSQDNLAGIEAEVAAAEKKGFVPADLKAKLDAAKKQAAQAKDSFDWQKQYLALQQKGVDMQLELINALKRVADAMNKLPTEKKAKKGAGAAATVGAVAGAGLARVDYTGIVPGPADITKVGQMSSSFAEMKTRVQEFMALPIGDKLKQIGVGFVDWVTKPFDSSFEKLKASWAGNWDLLVVIVNKTWNDIAGGVSSRFNAIRNAVTTEVQKIVNGVVNLSVVGGSTLWQDLGTIFGRIGQSFSNNIRLVFSPIGALVLWAQSAVTTFVQFWQEAWNNGIGLTFSRAWDAILAVANNALTTLVTVISNSVNTAGLVFGNIVESVRLAINLIASLIRGDWSQAWADFQGIVSNMWQNVQLTITTGVTNIGLLVSTAWTNLKLATQTTWNSMVMMIGSLVSTWSSDMQMKISQFVEAIVAFFVDLYNRLVGKSIIPELIDRMIYYFQLFVDVVTGIVTLVGTALIDSFNALKKYLTETLGPYFQWFADNVLKKFGEAIDGIIRGVEFLIGVIEDAINAMNRLTGKVNNSPVMGDSPSPFEISLRGIAAAAQLATAQLNLMNVSALGFSPALGAMNMQMAGATAGAGNSTTVSTVVNGGMNFPNVRDGRDALGVRRELARIAQQAYMTGRA